MSRISELINLSKKEPCGYKDINFGNVPNFQAQSINSQTGIDIKGAQKVLTTFGIRHAFSTHGDNSQETLRGQVGIKDSDFELIPNIFMNPDSVEPANKSKKGDDGLLFKKEIGQKFIMW